MTVVVGPDWTEPVQTLYRSTVSVPPDCDGATTTNHVIKLILVSGVKRGRQCFSFIQLY